MGGTGIEPAALLVLGAALYQQLTDQPARHHRRIGITSSSTHFQLIEE